MRTKITLVVLGLSAVILGGGRYWNNRHIDFTISKTPLISSSAEALSTSDWKTYSNSKYGVEFKYPSSYSLVESSGGMCEEDNTDIELIENKVKKGFMQMGGRCLLGLTHPSYMKDILFNGMPAIEWGVPGTNGYTLYELKNKPVVMIIYVQNSVLDQIFSTLKIVE